MSHATPNLRDVWRHLLRATLRECSYLPDPIARQYMHEYVLKRYRKKSSSFLSDKRTIQKTQYDEKVNAASPEKLQKTAKKLLSQLQRANQGYQGPLEKILMQSYGRKGAKRYSLLSILLRDSQDEGNPGVLDSGTDVKEFSKESAKERFGDDWKLPDVLHELVRSQRNNSFAKKRFSLANTTLNIPALNSWQRPVPEIRRRNIRKRYLNQVRLGVLPPPDSTELDVLRGLVHGTEPWEPPVRRVKVSPSHENAVSSSKNLSLEKFLLDGPQQGVSLKTFQKGRPHRLTRRFMRTLWEKVYNLMPKQEVSLVGQPKFDFPNYRRERPLIMSLKAEEFNSLFENTDQNSGSIILRDRHEKEPIHNLGTTNE